MSKRIISIILMILIVLSFSACDFKFSGILPTKPPTDDEIIAAEKENIKIGFTNIDKKKIIEEVLSIEELLKWKNPYGIYSSYTLYSTLNQNERLIYKALEYALTHAYKYTCIDYRIDVSQEKMKEIAELLSLDTPLLEQNILCYVYDHTSFYDYKYNEERTVSVLHRSKTISISNFKKELWEKKLEAIEEAENIISKIDVKGTELEKAEKIYRYVAQNIEYIPYENEYGHYKGTLSPFLYDGIINKKTHCDGFTNTMALLFAMAGLEQVEKHNNVTMGHTWNSVKIDGKWYNCDGTAGESIPKEPSTMGSGLYFAFADYLHKDYPNHKELYKNCSESCYMDADAFLDNCDYDTTYATISESFEKNKQEWCFVIVKEFSTDKAKVLMNNLAWDYNTSVKLVLVDCIDNQKGLLFVKENLL